MTPFNQIRWPGWSGLKRVVAGLMLPALLGCMHTLALAGPPRDRVTMLVPDDWATTTTWQVKVWQDSAADEGIRLELLTDSQFLAMGTTAPARIAGLVVPDSAHVRASAAVVAAIKQYAYTGGKLMLVYDAGVQDQNGFYPLAGNSRFADMVGVDYVFWNNGLGANTMVGFGQVVGTKARLEALSLPPGKYVPYVPPASLAMPTLNTAFVPATQADPGGSETVRQMIATRAIKGIEDGSLGVRNSRPQALRELLGLGSENPAALRFGGRNLLASSAINWHINDRYMRPGGQVRAVLNSSGSTYTEVSTTTAPADDPTLQAISGYLYGPLAYFHYVTTGSFPGTTWLSSPEHGLVAGVRTYGSGEVTFVNMPLGYFKAIGTDSAPLHGFLGLFAREQVGIATVSAQPKGVGGLIYNWHIDDGDDLNTNTRDLMNNTRVLNRGPYSIHLTAGPDVINFGDRKGMDLNNNGQSRDNLQRLSNSGFWYGSLLNFNKFPDHAIGSHGGWIHDFWGLNASEDNESVRLPSSALVYRDLLALNFDAIERVTGRKIREYSSPVGNTPGWAVRWMENRGVVAMYLVADLGNGMTRSYRNGARLSNKLWSSPVTPQGRWATFEEFDGNGITDATTGQWLLDLQSFVVNKRTNRMFYNHPPGAWAHLNPLNALLSRADTLDNYNRFNWYTMSQLADFSQRRVETSWSTSVAGSTITYSASHPSTLDDLTWLLPKARFNQPWVTWGYASVSQDANNWIVTSNGGTQLKFITSER